MLTYEERNQVSELAFSRTRELWNQATKETEVERKTRLILGSMQTVSTGGSFLDSGDHYGRNWERSALCSYGDPVPTSLSAKWGYLEVTIDLATYLGEFLQYDPEVDNHLQNWIDTDRQDSPSYWSDIQAYCDMLAKLSKGELGGIYGDPGELLTFNTYNEDNLLSQVFQGAFFYTPDNYNRKLPPGFDHGTPYLIMHTHNGCDVRGGYPRPRIFGFQGKHDPEGIFDWSRAYINIEEPDPRFLESPWGIPQWDTDDSTGFRYEGYPVRTKRDPEPMWVALWDDHTSGIHWVEWDDRNLEDWPFCDDPEELRETEGITPGSPGTGYIIDTGESVLCPITGSRLTAIGMHGM